MVSKTTVVKNPSGIHARPASLFVQEASKYETRLPLARWAETPKMPSQS